MPTQNRQRTSGAELPSADEFIAILKEESPRKAVKFDFLSFHPAIFGAHHKLSQLAGSDDSWVGAYPSLTLEKLVKEVNTNHDILAHYILQDEQHIELFRDCYRALVPPEDSSKTDALFVFGAVSNARIERAIELYKDGVAQKIIISGHRPFYSQDQQSEASRMARAAIESRVLATDLILEEASITTPDNVKRTLDLFDAMSWHPASLTVVATNFVLQRACMDWYKFTPWDITIKPVAARPQSNRFTEDGWYRDEETIALVLNEYAKLVIESKIDLMRADGEILT